MDEGDVVDASRQVGEERGDWLAALPKLLEAPLGADDSPLIFLAAAAEGLDRDRLAVQRVKVGLKVEGIDVARTAVHEQEDDALRLCPKRRDPGSERIDEGRDAVGRDGLTCEEAVGLHEPCKRRRPEAAADLPEEFAAGAATERAGWRTVRTEQRTFIHGGSSRGEWGSCRRTRRKRKAGASCSRPGAILDIHSMRKCAR